jgi:23S rRNA (guanosine2251-2'-O)-methyltransferase
MFGSLGFLMKVVILHDIRSHYNVGAIFRTADGAGVSRIYLAGYTPSPIDRFGRPVPEIHKTALGAELTLPYESVLDVDTLIKKLQAEGFVVAAIEQTKESIMLDDFVLPQKVAYILGSETEGIPPAVSAACDVVVEIPMLGEKESLNVSVAAGIVLYHS